MPLHGCLDPTTDTYYRHLLKTPTFHPPVYTFLF